MTKLCVDFLKSSMGLQSIKDLVTHEFAEHADKDLIQVHLTMFHATCMALDHNDGMSMVEMQRSSNVRARFAQVYSHAIRNIKSGRYGKSGMISYNNTLCEQWFHCNFQVTSEVEELTEAMVQTKIGESLLESAKAATDYLCSKIAKFTTSTLEGFLKCLQDAICGAFAPWMPAIRQALSWFGNIVQVLKNWASSINEGIHGVLAGIEECLFLGMGLVASTCIVALIEKFLVVTKIISKACGAPTIFLTTALAIVGTTYCVERKVAEAVPISLLLEFVTTSCHTVLSTFFSSYSRDPESYQGEFGPASMLESLAKVIQSWSSTTLTETGRTFGAISQIKNGVVA